MTSEQWQHLKDLLVQALELAPEKRSAFLDRACEGDHALRAEIDALLSEGDLVGANFLQSLPGLGDFAGLGDGAGDAAGLPSAGQVFAERFHLIRKLGEGGMGQVWLAEQTSPVRRPVAVKLIRAGMYDESVVKRFQSERQSLAIMDHPAIAKVFDAGATPQGQPYFVMEYVPGLPITEYCDQHKLKIADRLELFIRACEGVLHAHQKAIIHRDLKPANILVVEIDGQPVPRIIDFGLARATAPQVNGKTLFTQVGQLVGTPGYMSPEQADPNVKDIDTRTDVYSLGAILYVLLAGSQPFDGMPGEKLPLDEVLRRLREEDPPAPSTRVSSNRQISNRAAEVRGIEPRQLVNLLRGDLDWITMKALEKDRARRYGTPSELAADIHRYLRHEPVLARPAGTGYRLRKYVARHRVGVIAAAVLILLFAGFSVLQAVQLRRTTRERDRANRITDFMTEMFKVPDPIQSRGNTVTAREILDKASNDIDRGLSKDPEAQSQMMQVMASTYNNLALYDRAHDLAKAALDNRMTRLGPNDAKTLESMSQLGWILVRQGHYDEAEKLLRQAFDRERRVLGAEDRITLETMGSLAAARGYQGYNGEQEKLEREVIEAGTRKLGSDDEQVLRAKHNLGVVLWRQARYSEAGQEFSEVVEARRRVSGPDNLGTLNAMTNLALVRDAVGDSAEAESLYREVLATEERVLGTGHTQTAFTMENLSSLLIKEGHFAEAEKLSRTAMAVRTQLLGPEHHDTLVSKFNLSIALSKEGHTFEAEKLQREALTTQIRAQGAEHRNSLEMQTYLAETLIQERKYAEAERLARSTYEAQVRILGLQHSDTVETLRQLARALALTHRYDEASKMFRDAIEKDTNSPAQGNHFELWYAFACSAIAANHPDEALQYLREAIGRGYKDADALMADDDLRNLHPNPRFQQLVAQLKYQPTRIQTR